MKTFTKVLSVSAVLAVLGAGAAMARMDGHDMNTCARTCISNGILPKWQSI